MFGIDPAQLTALASLSTAIAALVAILTFLFGIGAKRKASIRASATVIRRNLLQFRKHFRTWHDGFFSGSALTSAIVALRDELKTIDVASLTSQQYWTSVEQHAETLAYDAWRDAALSPSLDRELSSMRATADDFGGLLSIVEPVSQLCYRVTKKGYSSETLAIVVEDMASKMQSRPEGSHREQIYEFSRIVRGTVALYLTQYDESIKRMSAFCDELTKQLCALSNKDLNCLSQVRASIEAEVVQSDSHTEDMKILLREVKRVVDIDGDGGLSKLVTDIDEGLSSIATIREGREGEEIGVE